ncbi:Hint domain-containing protein [Yoonia vestfoldensis]|uniref:Hint domain-containing protein n=1 Tax=Yoonia vestfoldensis TaxID=245188 RepID=UPI00036B71C1|nr:Hint domain-containing protein [Yoonia vestfoldensis]
MGFNNISEVTGFAGGIDQWTLTVDLSDPSVTMVSGDFDAVNATTGINQGDGGVTYTITSLSGNFGTYTNNFVLNAATGVFSFDIDRAAVIASGTDQVIQFQITGRSGNTSDLDTVRITLLICVARGTHIRCAQGQRRIEDLKAGDWVATMDAGLQQVRWIGSRLLSQDMLRDHPELRPVRIAVGSLGAGLPRRDLVVSPQHRILVSDWRAQLFLGQDDTLVPAKGLVNGTTVTVDTAMTEVEYFHLLFDRHQIIFTEGQPTESFHPADYTLGAIDADMRAEVLTLFPALAQDHLAYGPTAHHVCRVKEAKVIATAQASL